MTHPFLVADVGGTNTRLALVRKGKIDASSLVKLPNAGHDCLQDVLITYQDRLNVTRCAGAAVAIAGPVSGGAGQLTNLGWAISQEELANCCHLEDPGQSHVLNDLQAQGLALDLLDPQDLCPLITSGANPDPPGKTPRNWWLESEPGSTVPPCSPALACHWSPLLNVDMQACRCRMKPGFASPLF